MTTIATAFYLIITFWEASHGNFTSTTLPVRFGSIEQCEGAGQTARDHYNGGAHVEWTCVTTYPEGEAK